jgi:hypothetical protein
MTASRPPDIVAIGLDQVVGRIRTVPTDCDMLRAARALDIGFGDCAAAAAQDAGVADIRTGDDRA